MRTKEKGRQNRNLIKIKNGKIASHIKEKYKERRRKHRKVHKVNRQTHNIQKT